MTDREQFEVFSVAALNLRKKAHFAVIELSVYPNGDVLREICNRLQAARAAPAQAEWDEYGKVGTASWLANKRAQEDIDRAAPAGTYADTRGTYAEAAPAPAQPEGELYWADLGPSFAESPRNPNQSCFTLIRVVEQID